MAINHKAVMVLKARTPTVRVAEANTARDGSGTLHLLAQGPVDGVRIQKVNIRAAQLTPTTNSAMVASLFKTEAGGANPRYIEGVVITAVAGSATVLSAHFTIGFGVDGFFLEEDEELRVCQSAWVDQRDTMDYHAIIGNLGDNA